MQDGLDEKNKRALIDPGARRILVELVNLNLANDPNNLEAGQRFIDRYGQLGPGRDALHVLIWAQKFREAWDATHDPRKAEAVNRYLDEIFRADPTLTDSRTLYERPALAANFMAGKWEPLPRYLLDYLGLELMNCSKNLHRCERPECGRYMVKEFSRQHYCNLVRKWEREIDRIGTCGEVMRRRSQQSSAERKREETNRRRRKRSSK